MHWNVIDMDAFQILLGRSWKYNVDAVHKGRQNIYIFLWKEQKMALLPIDDNIPMTKQNKLTQMVFLNKSIREFGR